MYSIGRANYTADQILRDCRKFRLFLQDRTIKLQFLTDSGADASIMPATSQDKQSNEYKLYAANGTEIPTFGIKMLTLDLGLR